MGIWLNGAIIFMSACGGSMAGGYIIGRYNRQKEREADQMYLANLQDDIRAMREEKGQ